MKMVFNSLKEAFRTLTSNPFFWLIGIITGIAGSVGMYVVLTGHMYYYEVIMVLELVVLPFLIAGAFGTLVGERTSAAFSGSATKYYFRVLLPSALVVFITIILSGFMSVAALAGGAALSTIFFAAIVVFILLTYFYDTAAVFDECRVYESLKKSAEFVLSGFSRMILFVIINLAVIFAAGFLMVIIWGAILSPLFEPIITLPPEEIEAMFSTPEQLIIFLGDFGIIVSSVIYGLFMLLVTPFMYAFKACFYRNNVKAETLPEKKEEVQGEYDEKGRWYKY